MEKILIVDYEPQKFSGITLGITVSSVIIKSLEGDEPMKKTLPMGPKHLLIYSNIGICAFNLLLSDNDTPFIKPSLCTQSISGEVRFMENMFDSSKQVDTGKLAVGKVDSVTTVEVWILPANIENLPEYRKSGPPFSVSSWTGIQVVTLEVETLYSMKTSENSPNLIIVGGIYQSQDYFILVELSGGSLVVKHKLFMPSYSKKG